LSRFTLFLRAVRFLNKSGLRNRRFLFKCARWSDLPKRYGKHGTVSSRFYRWRAAGLWDRIFEAVQAQVDAEGRLDWEVHYVDATTVRAHQHAAGAKKSLDRTPKKPPENRL